MSTRCQAVSFKDLHTETKILQYLVLYIKLAHNKTTLLLNLRFLVLGQKIAFSVKKKLVLVFHHANLRTENVVTACLPLGWWAGDLERLFSLWSFLNRRLTKVLERCRFVWPAEPFSFCCPFFFFSKYEKKDELVSLNRIIYLMYSDLICFQWKRKTYNDSSFFKVMQLLGALYYECICLSFVQFHYVYFSCSQRHCSVR